ncbi:MAG: hypothetical protein ABEJ04_04115 [Halobacteriaceae archaeon]
MVDPSKLRDSTQIVLPVDSLGGDLRERVESEFVVTLFERGERLYIVGSPVVIKDVSDFLARQGVSLP